MTKTISRYFDIFVYSYLSWMILSMLYSMGFFENVINAYKYIPNQLSILTFVLVGMLTKYILINAGDNHHHHKLYCEGRYLIKNDNEISSVGLFDFKFKLKQFIVNPPLKLSIFAFLFIAYITNDIAINNYLIIEVACYFIGFEIPHLIKSIKYSQAIQSLNKESGEVTRGDDFYLDETPISTLEQDCLNRGELVHRLSEIITSSTGVGTKGIAIIGPFGVGKSSVINMTLSEVQMKDHSFLQCRIDSWGTYSSEEQIQKHLIEQVIGSLRKVTSTTSLMGLPSKYIHSLKGAQSLWLDILPVFDNHSSPQSQLMGIENILSKLKITVIIIIEDLDRNKDADAMLNSIAPIIDILNQSSSFRFIISIGEQLNNPIIINRICRYKEYITFDRESILVSIQQTLLKCVREKKTTYRGDIKKFFSKKCNNNDVISARYALLSYITNPRDLKLILRQVELDWSNSLYGCCDILDLFAITTLMHYEPTLITSMLNTNLSDISFEKIKNKSIGLTDKLHSASSSEKIVKFFFDTASDNKPRNRLQSCKHDPNKYLPLIVSRNRVNEEQREKEELYFSDLFSLNLLCKKDYLSDEVLEIIKKLVSYRKSYRQFLYDYNALYSKTSLIPALVLIKDRFINNYTGSGKTIESEIAICIKDLRLRTSNIILVYKLLSQIVECAQGHSISHLNDLYQNLGTPMNRRFIPKPSVKDVASTFKKRFDKRDGIDPHLLAATLDLIKIITSGNKKSTYYLLARSLINDSDEPSKEIIEIFEDYDKKNHLRGLSHIETLAGAIARYAQDSGYS